MRRTSSRILNAGAPVAGVGFCWSFCVHGGQLPHVENRSHQACTGRAAGAAGVDAAGMARCESSTWPFRGASRSTRWPPRPPRRRRSADQPPFACPGRQFYSNRRATACHFAPCQALATNRAPWRESRSQWRRWKESRERSKISVSCFAMTLRPMPFLTDRSEARDLVRRDATPVDDHRSLGHRDQSRERLRRVVAVAHVELAVRHGEDLPDRHRQPMA